MTEFAGYNMPLQYSGIMDEHRAVRQRAGLFDVSHMGEFFVMGPQAEACVQQLVTNDVAKLQDGKALYTLMCRPDGGIMDDLLVYRLREDAFMLVVNASNIEKDFSWIQEHNPMGALLHNTSSFIALLALQGPRSIDIAEKITDLPVRSLRYYHFIRPPAGHFLGCEKAIISRTGYTGEVGLEFYCEAESAPRLWDAVMKAGEDEGLKPAGLGARDTLRLEAGYCLYGNELDEGTNPFEARLGWVTKLNKGPFVGRDALRALRERGGDRTLVALVMEQRGIPRSGYKVLNAEGEAIGHVTSGGPSPLLRKGIGLGYVRHAYKEPGTSIAIEMRGRSFAARVATPGSHIKA